ncbi:MAG: hydantoinase/oxoprolinase family protein [Alphaproteobacteria bacterium]|nr:hydantoinase/oxoprolinase family protein [Alphaproteobacteria bacterium]
MAYRIGVDIGGTFTDFCVFNAATNALHSFKVLSTPDKPGSEVMEGLRQIEARFGVKPKDVEYFTHGTTVGVNTVIQRKGIKLCLITTENFADVLELARLKMPDPYHLFSRRPVPLVTRDRVLTVRERIAADGSVEEPIDEANVRAALAEARAMGAEGIVVALIHAYRNAAHEQKIKEIAQRQAPELPVYLSSEVWPIIREYERTVTTVINGYVQPRVAHYLGSLQKALAEMGVPAEPLVTKSNGGVMSAELGKTQCVQMVLSGTAAGVIGASFIARQAGIRNCMSLDIGGTSADVALIIDGQPQFGTGETIGEFPIYIPSVAVSSIGAGGGSIAWVDALGVLKVGPESAGSNPGPACFGRGGTRATITDAFAICGFIGQGDLGYSQVKLDLGAAKAAIGVIASKLGLGLEETAESIIKVACSGMYMEVSKLISRTGVDPRAFSLLAFGGAGPMLACFAARDLGMPNVLVPNTPGVLSAFGGLIADIKNDFIKTVYLDLDGAAAATIRRNFAELERTAVHWLKEEQRYRGESRLVYSADMRYRGQSFEIETMLDRSWVEAGDHAKIASAFHDRHMAVYGHSDPKAAVQVINLRLVIVGTSPKPDFQRRALAAGAVTPVKSIEVYLDGKRQKVPLYRRAELKPGQTFSGPAVILQDDTTTCVPGGYAGRVDEWGNLQLDQA